MYFMSPLGKPTAKKKANPLAMICPYLLPAYIVLSALFILYVIYGYLSVSVYQSGVQAGQQQAVLTIASQSVTEQACQSGVPLNIWNGQTATLINVQCLQQAPVEAVVESPAVEQAETSQ